MFFCFSVNKNKSKDKKSRGALLWLVFVLLISLCITAFVLTRLYCVPSESDSKSLGKISLEADTQSDREAFFEQFSVKAESMHSVDVVIPEEGEEFSEYLKLQESQGFELAPFMGKHATQYVLKLNRKSDQGQPLYGVITVYSGKVVAAHLTDFVYPSRCLPLSELN